MQPKKKILHYTGILLFFFLLLFLLPSGYFTLFSSDTVTTQTPASDSSSMSSPILTSTQVPTPSPVPTPTPLPTPTPTPIPTPTPVVFSSLTKWASDYGFSAAIGYESAPTPTTAPVCFDYNAFDTVDNAPAFSGLSCIVADADTGEIFLSANKERTIFPASTIKLLTALTALEHADLEQTCTSRAEVLDAIDSDVYVYGVAPNTSYPLDTWMKLLLIASCGDAADTIADCLGGGSKDVFVGWMNEKAQLLGMTHTIVDNPIGLDISNNFHYLYSTAQDMLLLSLEVFQNEDIMRYVAIPEYIVPANGRTISKKIENSNWLTSKGEQYQSELFTSLGGKTGSTDDAGKCLITFAKSAKGRNLVVLYFGAKTNKTMTDEIMTLLTYVCEHL